MCVYVLFWLTWQSQDSFFSASAEEQTDAAGFASSINPWRLNRGICHRFKFSSSRFAELNRTSKQMS